MQATIQYEISEQTQRELISATGQSVPRKQKHTIEIDPVDVNILKVDENGNATANLEFCYLGGDVIYLPINPASSARNPEEAWSRYKLAIGAEIEKRKAQAAERLAKLDADIDAYLSDPLSNRAPCVPAGHPRQQEVVAESRRRQIAEEDFHIDTFFQTPTARGSCTSNGTAHLYYNDTAGAGTVVNASPRLPALREEINRRNDADQMERRAAEKAKVDAKEEFLREWVAQNADVDTKQQYADGLLDRKDLLAMIADSEFAKYGILDHDYVPRVCGNRCDCYDSYRDTIPRDTYQTWRKIKAALPEATTVQFSKVRECVPDGDCAPVFYTALITIPVGPFRLDRTIVLESPAQSAQ